MIEGTAPARHFEIREWRELPIGPEGVSTTEAEQLWAAARSAAVRLKLPSEAVLTRTHTGLKAGQVCGILQAGGVTVEILPKIDGDLPECRQALVRMLAASEGLPIADGEIVALAPQGRDLLDIFVDLFLTRLEDAVRAGLDRRYDSQDDLLPLLRGRLDARQQLSRRPLDPSRLHCRFDELTEITPLNRLFRSGLDLLHRLARRAGTRRRIVALLSRFDNVPPSLRPLEEAIKLDRMTHRFAPALRLARLLLAAEWQSTTSGRAQGLALLFPMNILFEKFVASQVSHHVPQGSLVAQSKEKALLSNGHFRLIPDLILLGPSGKTVVDTKWKELDPSDGETFGVAQADLYQLLAYGTSHQAARLVLLYPHHGRLGSEGVHRSWTFSGTGLCIDIASLDIKGLPVTKIRLAALGLL